MRFKINYCKYCKLNKAIDNSHIIPSYIYKWIKKTSVTGYLRSSENPNVRKQDGEKSKLLCLKCEESFSVFENTFKIEVFDKLETETYDKFIMSEASIKCIYIMVWRIIANFYYFTRFKREHSFTNEEIKNLPHTLSKIKNFIEEDYYNECFIINIISFSDRLLSLVHNEDMFGYFKKTVRQDLRLWENLEASYADEISSLLYNEKIHYYSERSVGYDLRVWDDPYTLITYIKIPYLLIIFEIERSKCENNLRLDIIKQAENVYLYREGPYPFYTEGLLSFLLKGYFDGLSIISDKQVKKIIESYDRYEKD